MRLGDLDALKEQIKNAFKHNFNGCDALLVNEIYEFIDNAPTVEPLERIGSICEENCGYRPKGEWIIVDRLPNGELKIRCHNCKADFRRRFLPNFCEFCGADMREGGAE